MILSAVSLLLHVLVLSVHADTSSPGFSLPPCNVTLQTLDLGSFLHWECPPMPPNTTFTVETHTQGKSKWKKVLQCTGVTSRSCDLSQAFSSLDLYNFVRLNRTMPGEHPAWTWQRMVDLSSEMVFSAPTLALSLNGSRLRVELWFPISLSRSLCPGKKTCSVAMVMRPTTNITVYEVHQPCEGQPLVFSGAPATCSSTCDHLLHLPLWQTHSQQVMEEQLSFEFENLKEGWSYCAVANFTGSATAAPCCISLAPGVTVLKPLPVTLGACCMLFISAAILFLFRRYWPSTESPLPRPLGSLQDFSSRELAMSPEDCAGDHLSVLSLSVSSPALPAAADALRDDFSLPCGYYDNPLRPDSMGEEDWEDWEASSIPLQDHEAVRSCGSPMGSLAACDGMRQLPLGSGGPWDIPLCSVRLAPPEAEALQDWIHFPGPTGLKEAAPLAERTELGQTEPAVDFCFSDD
ncbi:uncharacterized protein si:dkeyp-75h12.7 [Brienomyrus brachyistius]|uniref:uncharacterized protein si:dkeyp-75h12.7 n=1 Tax=Brienomyrus brachyistius TaxID=42636 RepID=UPI0020B19013|nr:uncharacterized protein si:dkeyp-75h12.7 [Brienomyrus brachyistius]XP_048827281.1 uncharacterized protein si:dkeyp-75h12.7 [Brienomyrus brachyistius]